MKPKRQYSIEISMLLIFTGTLQLFWPESFWLSLYRILAGIGLLFLLLSLVVFVLTLKHGHLVGKGRLPPLRFRTVAFLRLGTMLLIAWMLKDQWAWWLSVALVFAGGGFRWLSRKLAQQIVKQF